MTNTAEATLVDRDDHPTIRFERTLRAPVERVWRAMTDEDEMRSWFPSAVQGERKVGAPLRFPFDDHIADAFDGQVTVWEPMHVFAFTWNGDELRIELEPDGEVTKLVFTHELHHLTGAARTAAGWQACLASLDAHLGGPTPSPEMWKDTYADYLQRMGPPAGVATASGAMTWERITHVDAATVKEATAAPHEWGASARAAEPIEWHVETAEHGTTYTLTHATAGRDPEVAAAWHALLAQLDMWLAAHQLVPADPDSFRALYRA